MTVSRRAKAGTIDAGTDGAAPYAPPLMESAAVRTAIAACPLFQRVDPRRIDLLRAASRGHEVPPRSMLFRQGDACPGIILVASGAIRVFKLAPNGKEHVLRVVHAPESFLEVPVLGGFDCPACAETIEPTSYVIVPTGEVRELVAGDHEFCQQLLSSMSLRVLRLVNLLEDVVLRDATARIAKHLYDQADERTGVVFLEASHKDIALHLNLTPETLSRALRRLQDDDLVELRDGRLHVSDRERLEMAIEGPYPRL